MIIVLNQFADFPKYSYTGTLNLRHQSMNRSNATLELNVKQL